jgi:hypothetical protein
MLRNETMLAEGMEKVKVKYFQHQAFLHPLDSADISKASLECLASHSV